MRIDLINSLVATGGPVSGLAKGSSEASSSFAVVLEKQVSKTPDIRFSGHAQKRLNDRNILFSDQDMARIAQSTDDAMAKGSKESLLLMDELALVVGIPKRTVITVMDAHERENTVFTNIDSVVMVAKAVPSSPSKY